MSTQTAGSWHQQGLLKGTKDIFQTQDARIHLVHPCPCRLHVFLLSACTQSGICHTCSLFSPLFGEAPDPCSTWLCYPTRFSQGCTFLLPHSKDLANEEDPYRAESPSLLQQSGVCWRFWVARLESLTMVIQWLVFNNRWFHGSISISCLGCR